MATQTENVNEEIQNEEVVQPSQEQESQAVETQEVSPDEAESNTKEYNFKQLRESNKQLEERLKKSDEIIESFTRSNQPVPQPKEKLGKDDLAEGRHLEELEAKFEQRWQQKELEMIPDRLKTKFDDFDQVVTKETLEKLEKTEPELYRTIQSGTDLFAKGVAAYKTIKSQGFTQEQHDYMKQKEQAQTNHKKPLSAQAVKGQGALHDANIFANGLTPELKKQLQKEMAEAVKAR